MSVLLFLNKLQTLLLKNNKQNQNKTFSANGSTLIIAGGGLYHKVTLEIIFLTPSPYVHTDKGSVVTLAEKGWFKGYTMEPRAARPEMLLNSICCSKEMTLSKQSCTGSFHVASTVPRAAK